MTIYFTSVSGLPPSISDLLPLLLSLRLPPTPPQSTPAKGLDMHTDDSDVTLNVCHGRDGFRAAGLRFCEVGYSHHWQWHPLAHASSNHWNDYSLYATLPLELLLTAAPCSKTTTPLREHQRSWPHPPHQDLFTRVRGDLARGHLLAHIGRPLDRDGPPSHHRRG